MSYICKINLVKVLFVCLGNICRSPTAEGVFRSMVAKKGLKESIQCDSAGTSAHHAGAPADVRSSHHAKLRGYDLTSTSRQLKSDDFFDYDLILTMDDSNFKNVCEVGALINANLTKVKKLTDFCKIHNLDQVPDPYYTGDEGFELVLDIIEDACEQILQKINMSKF